MSKNSAKLEFIKFHKGDESLELGVKKNEHIIQMIDLRQETENETNLDSNEEQIICQEVPCKLGIAPSHIKDFQIKKPDEKEPSLFKFISNKIRGHDTNQTSSQSNKSSSNQLQEIKSNK